MSLPIATPSNWRRDGGRERERKCREGERKRRVDRGRKAGERGGENGSGRERES